MTHAVVNFQRAKMPANGSIQNSTNVLKRELQGQMPRRFASACFQGQTFCTDLRITELRVVSFEIRINQFIGGSAPALDRVGYFVVPERQIGHIGARLDQAVQRRAFSAPSTLRRTH